MSGINTKLTYTQLQTLKHALLFYIQRDNITKSEYASEQALLLKVNQQIETMKERYDI